MLVFIYKYNMLLCNWVLNLFVVQVLLLGYFFFIVNLMMCCLLVEKLLHSKTVVILCAILKNPMFVISYFHLCICLLLVFIFCLLCAIAYLFCVIILAELFQLMHLGIWCSAAVFSPSCFCCFMEKCLIS